METVPSTGRGCPVGNVDRRRRRPRDSRRRIRAGENETSPPQTTTSPETRARDAHVRRDRDDAARHGLRETTSLARRRRSARERPRRRPGQTRSRAAAGRASPAGAPGRGLAAVRRAAARAGAAQTSPRGCSWRRPSESASSPAGATRTQAPPAPSGPRERRRAKSGARAAAARPACSAAVRDRAGEQNQEPGDEQASGRRDTGAFQRA